MHLQTILNILRVQSEQRYADDGATRRQEVKYEELRLELNEVVFFGKQLFNYVRCDQYRQAVQDETPRKHFASPCLIFVKIMSC